MGNPHQYANLGLQTSKMDVARIEGTEGSF